MSGIHLFGRNEFGTACIRCGYFNHTEEAGKDCSGRYDEKRLSDINDAVSQLEQKRSLIIGARDAQTTAQGECEEKK